MIRYKSIKCQDVGNYFRYYLLRNCESWWDFIVFLVLETHFLFQLELIFLPKLINCEVQLCVRMAKTRHSNDVTESQIKVAHKTSSNFIHHNFSLFQDLSHGFNNLFLFFLDDWRDTDINNHGLVIKRDHFEGREPVLLKQGISSSKRSPHSVFQNMK